jgi:homoaconitase
MNKEDYSRIGYSDSIETVGLDQILHGSGDSTLLLRVTRKNGETFDIETYHTLSQDQLHWLWEGSALNYIRKRILRG